MARFGLKRHVVCAMASASSILSDWWFAFLIEALRARINSQRCVIEIYEVVKSSSSRSNADSSPCS